MKTNKNLKVIDFDIKIKALSLSIHICKNVMQFILTPCSASRRSKYEC